MHSAFGGIIDSAAAFRCGLTRPTELDGMVYFDAETLNEQVLIGYPASHISRGFQGSARLALLASKAIQDLKLKTKKDFEMQRATDVSLCFSSNPHWLEKLTHRGNFATWVAKLNELSQIDIFSETSFTLFEGRVGVVAALARAIKKLQAGECDYSIVGAVDSQLEPAILLAAMRENRLKTTENQHGFIPGEAACFIAMKRRSDRSNFSISSALTLTSEKRKNGDSDEDESLKKVVAGLELYRSISQSMRDGKIDNAAGGGLYTDLNGEEIRAKVFGEALMRVNAEQPGSGWNVEIPALSFGDTGAASTLLPICLFDRALKRGYSVKNQAVISVMDENNSCGIVSLKK